MMDEFSLSYSSVSAFRQCMQLYTYRYLRKIVPVVEKPAPTLGSAIHTYLETFYKNLGARGAAHKWAINGLESEWAETCKGYSHAAMAVGQQELAQEFSTLVPRARQICDRYYLARGKADQQRYDVLYCEWDFTYPLIDGVTTKGRIDLVTLDKVDGGVALWDHKTTRSIPQRGRRIRDLQTTLYKAILEETTGTHVDRIVWNYLRTKEPTEPELLKSGGLSKRKDLDSTWETYRTAIRQHGLDTADYTDVQIRLHDAELTNFFPRSEMPIVADEHVLLRDMVTSAKHVRNFRKLLAADPSHHVVRTVTFMCDSCAYNRLCEAAITGGEEAMVLRQFYTQENQQGEANASDDIDVTEFIAR